MVETITPAGCGSRRRYRIALALFAVGAVLASAALGALLGLAGSALDRTVALAVVAVLALVAAARELGLIPGPVPGPADRCPSAGGGSGRCRPGRSPTAPASASACSPACRSRPSWSPAPARWRSATRSWRPPAWRHSASAAPMVILPTMRNADPAAAVGRMAARSRLVRPVNAAALVAVAALIGASPALGQAPPPPAARGGFDPAAWGDVAGRGPHRPPRGPERAGAPSRRAAGRLAGGGSRPCRATCCAYADAAGIRVVRWTTGEQVARLDGPYDAPAIEWPLVAFRVQDPSGAEFLEVADLTTGERRGIAGARPNADLGRPALRGGLIAWHLSTGRRSQVRLRPVAAGPQRSKVIASSR